MVIKWICQQLTLAPLRTKVLKVIKQNLSTTYIGAVQDQGFKDDQVNLSTTYIGTAEDQGLEGERVNLSKTYAGATEDQGLTGEWVNLSTTYIGAIEDQGLEGERAQLVLLVLGEGGGERVELVVQQHPPQPQHLLHTVKQLLHVLQGDLLHALGLRWGFVHSH